ncbi:uncharacterized protein MONBRDRAFT_26890 [Monosiga brevicollis MX1]|uniref:Uncharacterized protein n=1 Tax=Monosiga brevicollis TaxID=81824 RepID=A9V3U2_MONBE|nr:uncharacterized protein MONBRDRAFT_26890 [Monosiga brevicollis MX1]EDQ87768.1 predicted protein [Monosiga brevicollis MX1]|eukprot:XP_001747301.1 hypothetical protein [Monosiga brevicollis MX1]
MLFRSPWRAITRSVAKRCASTASNLSSSQIRFTRGALCNAALSSVFHTGLPDGAVSAVDTDVVTRFGELREEARLLKREEATKFAHLARKGLAILESAPEHSRFHFPLHLCYLDLPSPVASIFDLLLTKVFQKSHDTRLGPQASQNNHSGFALSGQLGVGKSHTLRLVSTLAPLLLDNVLSVYMDAQNFESDSTRPKPWQLLRAAIMAHRIDVPMLYNPHKILSEAAAESDSIRDLLSVCEGNIMPLFVLDELSHVYRDHHTWHNLCAMVTSYYTCIFVDDSTSRLDSMVKRTDDHLLKKWFDGTIQESLNDTKLPITRLFPLSEARQYEKYFQHLFPLRNVNINGVHLITGGKLRDVAALLDKAAVDNVAIPTLPSVGTPERYALQAFVAAQGTINALNKDGRFDPFRLATINIADVYGLLDRSSFDCSAAEVVAGMLENKLLARAPKEVVEKDNELIISAAPHEASNLTFGSPAHYLFLTHVVPHIFISYSEEDSDKAAELQTQLERYQLRVSTYKDPRIAANIQRLGWKGWMQHEAKGVGQGTQHFCIVMLTRSYLEKLQVPTSGCSEEVDHLRKTAQDEYAGLSEIYGSACRNRLLLLASDSYEDLKADYSLMTSPAAQWFCNIGPDNKADNLIFTNSELGSLMATIFSLTTAAKPQSS